MESGRSVHLRELSHLKYTLLLKFRKVLSNKILILVRLVADSIIHSKKANRNGLHMLASDKMLVDFCPMPCRTKMREVDTDRTLSGEYARKCEFGDGFGYG